MVIYLAGEVDEEARLDEMSPRQIVTELDKHVAESRATAEARPGNGSRRDAQKHHHDRLDRRW
jgi:hypothetical protein